jgi:hypothetical protein
MGILKRKYFCKNGGRRIGNTCLIMFLIFVIGTSGFMFHAWSVCLGYNPINSVDGDVYVDVYARQKTAHL